MDSHEHAAPSLPTACYRRKVFENSTKQMTQKEGEKRLFVHDIWTSKVS